MIIEIPDRPRLCAFQAGTQANSIRRASKSVRRRTGAHCGRARARLSACAIERALERALVVYESECSRQTGQQARRRGGGGGRAGMGVCECECVRACVCVCVCVWLRVRAGVGVRGRELGRGRRLQQVPARARINACAFTRVRLAHADVA
eukprot:6199962-Pleurochrysis_carterae.AAC.1